MSATRGEIIPLILTLGIASLISGVVMVGVYTITKPRIDRNKAEALEAAIYRVLPGAKTRRAFVLTDDKLTALDAKTIPPEDAVFAGFDAAGKLIGYAIPMKGPGFQDDIKLLYGYDPARQIVVGMEVLESRETPGLGDKIIKDQNFRKNFHALAVDPEIIPVKNGAKKNPNEVDCISGATISSRAVVKIINHGNTVWKKHLSGTVSASAE